MTLLRSSDEELLRPRMLKVKSSEKFPERAKFWRFWSGGHGLDKKAQLTQGLRATAVRVYRHLRFLKFESCTISSAVRENPTVEQMVRRSANRL